jgi:hypothetical protein
LRNVYVRTGASLGRFDTYQSCTGIMDESGNPHLQAKHVGDDQFLFSRFDPGSALAMIAAQRALARGLQPPRAAGRDARSSRGGRDEALAAPRID